MNKVIKEFFKNKGFTWENNTAYGEYMGFELNIDYVFLDSVSPLRIYFSTYLTDQVKQNVNAEFRLMDIKHLTAEPTGFGIVFGINDWTMGALVKRLDIVLDMIARKIIEMGGLGKDYCPYCGLAFNDDFEYSTYLEMKVKIHSSCREKINDELNEEKKDFDNLPNNYLKGVLGALIGGLAGFAISFGLYMLGFISSLSVIVAIALGTFLYQKFGGKPNWIMVLIVCFVSLVCVALSVFAVYIYSSVLAVAEVGLEMSSIEAFKLCMEDDEFSSLFVKDLSLTLVFSLVGLIFEIISMVNKLKKTPKV